MRRARGSPLLYALPIPALHAEWRLPVVSVERHAVASTHHCGLGPRHRLLAGGPLNRERVPDTSLAQRRASQSWEVIPLRESVRRVGLPGVATSRFCGD